MNRFVLLAGSFALGVAAAVVWKAAVPDKTAHAPVGAATSAKSPARSLIHGVPYVDRPIVPSSLLGLLGPWEGGEERVLATVIREALQMTPEEVAATERQLRRLADNWAIATEVRAVESSRWQIHYPESGAKAQLSELATWAESLLGPQRGYLLLVMMAGDLQGLFLPKEVFVVKEDEARWQFIVGQRSSSFDMNKLRPDAPMVRLRARCETP